MTKKDLIAKCIYYKGEDKNPFEGTEYGILWFYERKWVELSLESNNSKIDIGEYYAYGCKGFEEDDGTPLTLKALLWNRYYHWNGINDPDSASFKKWYKNSYRRGR